jgi:putative tryptophan/tyrosine transport system substrate-binding protein
MLGMRRREFITLLGGAAATWPLAARAQQHERVRHIGVFMDLGEGDPEGQIRVAALKRGLQDLGWIEGRNLRIETRWAAGEAAQMKPLAAELVSLAPEVIVSSGAPTLVALQQATRTIPLVFGQVVDPVAAGFVDSLSRPGGNITGFSNFEFAMGGKWLGTLKEMVPSITRVAILRETPGAGVGSIGMLGAIQAVTPSFALPLTIAQGRDAVEFERAIDALANEPGGGLIVLPAPTTIRHRQSIIASVARHRVPTIYPYRFFVKDGGLISYGIIPSDMFRRAAAYVDAILKGAKPSDLPVQQPTKFEMVINLTTAKALGLTIPPTLLARADEVTE